MDTSGEGSFRDDSWKDGYWSRTQQDQLLSTKVYLPQGDRGQGIRDREEIEDREEGEGTRGEGWIFTRCGEEGGQRTASGDRRQTWPTGKWRFVKGKGKPMLGQDVFILIGHVN